MDKLDSYIHELEHLYYDNKNWAQHATFYDVFKSKALPAAGLVILLVYLIKKVYAKRVWSSKVRLDGKTVIVTGSTSGIGLEAAKDFYGRGARVIMACRNRDKAQKATNEIFNAYKSFSWSGVGEIINYTIDLSSMTSIQEFCKEILEKEHNIDILINNAGILQPVNHQQYLTEDGFDLTIGTNHLGPFLLTNLLLEKLSQSNHKPARIVNVASRAYAFGKINLVNLNYGAAVPFPGSFRAYGQSKLCNIFFTQELAKRTKELNICTYSLHPGTVTTNIATNKFPWYFTIFLPFIKLFSKSVKEGAQTTIFCAVEESIASESGKYYENCKEKRLKDIARDEETAEKLWLLSEKLVKLENKPCQ